MDMTDVFPAEISESVQDFGYPEKDFARYMQNRTDRKHCPLPVKVFLPHLNDRKKLYYQKRKYSGKYDVHMNYVGKRTRTCNKFRPNDINWSKVANKLKLPLEDPFRANVDGRVGFKSGNAFLVKAGFTFGQRTVAAGTAHVYQILRVPLLFFLMEDAKKKRLRVEERSFPYREFHLYDRRILCPGGRYVVPAGTTYVVYAVQKTFFALDVVLRDDESGRLGTDLPFDWVDPVATRVVKLNRSLSSPASPYDVPPKTPYIETEDQEPVEVYLDDGNLPEHRLAIRHESVLGQPSLSWVVVQQQDAPPTVLQLQAEEQQRQVQQQVQLQLRRLEEICAADSPAAEPCDEGVRSLPPSVFERNVIVASPPFLEIYGSLKRKTYDDPRKVAKRACPAPFVDENEIPMDLTCRGSPAEPPPRVEVVELEEDVDRMLEEIMTRYRSSDPAADEADAIEELMF